MSDAAFKTAPFPSLTNADIRETIARLEVEGDKGGLLPLLRAERDRRAAVAAGDVSQMTSGERLRHVRANP